MTTPPEPGAAPASGRQPSRGSPEAATTRIEAFSDGVIAVAITLLVLDLHVPDLNAPHFLDELASHWPEYVAYLVSFGTIGIIWINHHAVFTLVRAVDRTLLLLNLLLLLTVTIIPFTTRVVERALDAHKDQGAAAALYSGSFLVMGMAFGALFTYAVRRERLRAAHVDLSALPRVMLRFTAGTVVYVAATIVSLVDYRAGLAMDLAVGVYYAVIQVESQ